jgi:hypothetical protein
MPDPSMSPGWRHRLKSFDESRADADTDPARRAHDDEPKEQHFELLQEWLRTKRPTPGTEEEHEKLGSAPEGVDVDP